MSSAVARLEHELGVLLFDRSVTPVAVTEHGAVLRASAQRVLDAVEAARDDVAAVSGQVRGTVVLGTTLSTGPLDLAAVLTGVRDQHPGMVVHVRQSTAGSAGNLNAVAEGSMDIALTASAASPETGHPSRGVVLHPLVSEALVFACRPDHPLSGRPGVSVSDLAGETILQFPPGWGIRETVRPGLRRGPRGHRDRRLCPDGQAHPGWLRHHPDPGLGHGRRPRPAGGPARRPPPAMGPVRSHLASAGAQPPPPAPCSARSPRRLARIRSPMISSWTDDPGWC